MMGTKRGLVASQTRFSPLKLVRSPAGQTHRPLFYATPMASRRLAGRLFLSGSRIPGRQFTRLYSTAPPPGGSDNNANHHAKPRTPHHLPTPPKRTVPSPPPSHSQAVPTPPGARHEVHEGTQTLSAPYNPPGGGPGGAAGGGFAFTGSPVLDAVLTTCIGLGAGV